MAAAMVAQAQQTRDFDGTWVLRIDGQNIFKLTLANGRVYMAWASHCDTGNYHGWILGYDATTLQQKSIFVTTPNGAQAGIWMSGEGASVDDDGNLYYVSGNGSFDANTGGPNYGETVLKLNRDLQVLDWFTPYNYDALNGSDLDLGAAGPLVADLDRVPAGTGHRPGSAALAAADVDDIR